ncbi:sulfotransferase family protein [Phaeovulum sp.]|jgi:hypothetical protein|uniref:sulfotransferase family protein n=1 Tax=Phaeovulum sp. TaxID=2934796 RepID=UPI00272FADB3|nr:sulfotransferase family protein [Phaeovulum sp.]MDP1670273.1 sulfotransferase [Phaeovulum sp.]MDZ4118037.1 sulfotransferase [Phaeovulum sp.]
MALEIIGAGFGRTGTHSLKLALEHLGFGPCHHMYEVRAHQNQLAFWRAAGRGEPVDWNAVFLGYRSQVDWPGAHYWRELLAHFPKAKVILTVREPHAWYESLRQTILRSLIESRPDDPDPYNRAVSDMVHDLTFSKAFGGRMDDRDHALAVYESHNRSVKAGVPPERLLVYDVADGWAPLCGFLCVTMPEVPFPRTNSTQEFLVRKKLVHNPDSAAS